MIELAAGITPAGEGQDGTAYPPSTFVPLHVHPTQDEFIYVLEGVFDLQLGGKRLQAQAGDLVRMPRGLPHAYHNNQTSPARACCRAASAHDGRRDPCRRAGPRHRPGQRGASDRC